MDDVFNKENEMDIKVKKIDGEFTVVELINGEKKVCPTGIFPSNVKEEDTICIFIRDKI